jgi:hypothetical protein
MLESGPLGPRFAMPLEVQRRGVEHARVRRRSAVDDRLRQRIGAQQDVRAGADVRGDRDREVIGERQHPEDSILFAELSTRSEASTRAGWRSCDSTTPLLRAVVPDVKRMNAALSFRTRPAPRRRGRSTGTRSRRTRRLHAARRADSSA